MPTDYEALAKMLISSPQGGRIIRGLDKFNAAISSENGRQLLNMLAGVALVFVAGIALAAVAKDSTFTAEWANMIAWFETWAR